MPSAATLSIDEFVAKWRDSGLSESQGAQSHFHDLCAVLGVATPSEPESYTFERAVHDSGGTYVGAADVWKKGCFGWEYKSPGKSLSAAYDQLRGYQEGLDYPPILIVSDMRTFEIHTTFESAPSRTIRFTLKQLGQNPAHYRKILRDVFEPSGSGRDHPLHPDRDQRYITETAAAKVGEVAQALRELDHDPNEVARFLNRLIFCFFAESIGLFLDDDRNTHEPVTLTLKFLRRHPARSRAQLGAIFDAMSKREITDFGPYPTPWFNGGLFDESASTETFSLTADLVHTLLETADLDWSQIDPAILGTLFERGLDPNRRSELGAHYTDPDNIMRVVEPVILRPLRHEFDELRSELEPERRVGEPPGPGYGSNGALELGEPSPDSPAARIRALHDRLAGVRVLDPACGSGNFLYVAMRELQRLEQELISWANRAFGINSLRRRVGPANMLGIDIDQFAVDLTRMSLWIGDIQWTLQQGLQRLPEPILGQMEQIECRDAILDEDEEGKPVAAAWPEAEFIVGNPPFLGMKKIREELGAAYAERLRDVYGGDLGARPDLCAYWHELARRRVEGRSTGKAGLLATNSIRHSYSRRVLERILATGGVFFAFSDEPWVNDGAAVRIAIVGQDDGSTDDRYLDGDSVSHINPDLSTGATVSDARQLSENANTAFTGDQRNGDFDISSESAARMLSAPLNVNGRPNQDVIFPFVIARDLAARPRRRYIVDFGLDLPEVDAAKYELPFEHIRAHVRPGRITNEDSRLRDRWWLHQLWRPRMRAAIEGLDRFLATPLTSKFRFYVWLTPNVVPDATIVAIAREDDYTFGVLHSRIHERWALARASRLGVGNDPRYVHTQCFNTFPFPWELDTPDDALSEDQAEQRDVIAGAAASLNAQREAWLNPSDAGAHELRLRTMTNLYNERPTWLDIAHKEIDEAVCAAYGWSADLADDDVLADLLALNSKRAAQ